MSRVINYLPRAAIFLAGVAVGVLSRPRRERGGGDPALGQELKNSLADLEARLVAQESAATGRFTQVEARLDEHTGRLANVPSTTQIVTGMEQLVSKTMTSLDDRLTTQARSIEVLKTAVSQTDSLLERVLESLDTLQVYTDPAELGKDTLLQRPA